MMWELQQNKAMTWAGRIITGFIVIALTASATMKLIGHPEVVKGMEQFGIAQSMLPLLAGLQIMCVVAYVIPTTSILGAILFTGYFGGVMITHLRGGESPFIPIFLGILVWLGVWMREPRLRALMPCKCSKKGS